MRVIAVSNMMPLRNVHRMIYELNWIDTYIKKIPAGTAARQ